MTFRRPRPLSRDVLLDYFLRAATPRSKWRVGMELERMGRTADGGKPIPYDGDGPTVRKVLEHLLASRGGDPVYEGDHLTGIDGPWGTISLEPGGQVEWSSQPRDALSTLASDLTQHTAAMRSTGEDLGVRWLAEAADPDLAVEVMPWMPKSRYRIMRPFLGERGRLAHRMMTQTASIQCAFDFEDPGDWSRKFRVGALLAPVATALFANSSAIDGGDSGYRSYRQAIWQETDPDRCGLPAVVFEPHFDIEAWLDWVLQVPTIFRHRGRGLVPTGGVPFSELLERRGCDAIQTVDWETHISTIFTDVRSYTYIEIRSADALPNDRVIRVPTFWTGLIYNDDSLDAALELGRCFGDHASWSEAMDAAARSGLDGRAAGCSIRELAAEALTLSIRGLENGAVCAAPEDASPLKALADGLGT